MKAAGLAHRFAVIQETYRPDKAEYGMYFDEALWRRLLEFARGIAPGARVGIVVPVLPEPGRFRVSAAGSSASLV